MKITDFTKRKENNFFTLEEIENVQNKNGVLILDSSFFIILPITIDIIDDPREREMEVDDKIEEVIEDYSPIDFISKEIHLKIEDEQEKILIILLERGKIESIIAQLKEKGITLSGIYPLFLLEFFNKEEEAKTYIEINEEGFRLYYFKDERLNNFNQVEFSLEDLMEDDEYLQDYIEDSYVFTYSNTDKEIYSNFYFINFRDWHKYKLFYNRDLDFLPPAYQESLHLKSRVKILTAVLSVFIIIQSISSLLLNVYISNKKNYLHTIENRIGTLQEAVNVEKLKIVDIEKKLSLLNFENKEGSFSGLKISTLLKNIMDSKHAITIDSIEFTDKKILKISGITSDEENFYDFEKNILTYKIFRKINHDFFTLNDNSFNFKLEIEVNDET
ncbi:hypothetical protein IX317_000931 [Fusobacterium sp. DD29]|uniref:hypothetical protein n=1 Tax=unclassified Fusobacterium TaxID=2648384 RepID=UPI001B8B6403|nr:MULTISPECIES: hypothetical protein [unclassified Fusobacterium]MBR8700607.1 hypothetical protein [Fusobacterium sp. DD45]MBR8710143.1 hypothetical protein [Fusobacterium sp. DD28]MBR8749267.1 hypothetical protein [Fusobacterium sp. DD29]MBR8750864.1 hypothetical protein [Fusobacterium sp. DD26]MBR8761523.1 hypothetical protein [Fusobacterium sp. DD25]